MIKGWLKTSLLYVVTLAIVAGLGVWLGAWLGERRAEAGRQSEQADLQTYLEQNIVGIEVGRMFPDIPIWSADGRDAFGIHELLPQGGVLVYVATGCNSCVDAITALDAVQRAAGAEARPALVVLDGHPDSLAAGLAAAGIEMTFYHDVERSFTKLYRVAIFPSAFVIDEHGRVTEIVAGPNTRNDFQKIVIP